MKCDKCSRKSDIFLPYGPHHFCEDHFTEFFEHRVRKTIRMNNLVKPKEKVAIGISGGKDSLTTAYLLSKIFSKTNKIVGIMIDEGIRGYRTDSIKTAQKCCNEWGLDFEVHKLKDCVGYSMDEIMKIVDGDKNMGSSCSYCGVFRRNVLNEVTQGFDKFATGHNLDDEVQSITMNIFDNNIPRLARLGPISGVKKIKGLVPRIKPLYECPEKEIIAYANFVGINYYKKGACPYSWQAKRNAFREMLNDMEEKFPGTKFSILRSFLKMRDSIKHFGLEGSLSIDEDYGANSFPQQEKLIKKIENYAKTKHKLKKTEWDRSKYKTSNETKGLI